MNVSHKKPRAATGWDRRRADTGQRILDAAERLASEAGVEALTMQRLGQQLGYQAGALYRYFPSKEALLSALLVRTVDEVSARVAAATAASKGVVARARRPVPAATQALLPLVLAARGYLQLSRARPAQMALLVRALAAPLPVVDDAAAQSLAEQTLKLMGEVAALLHAAEAARALAPGDGLQRVALLWAGLQGLVGNPKLLRFELPGLNADGLVDAFLRTLLLGWGAKPRVVDDTFERAARAGEVAP